MKDQVFAIDVLNFFGTFCFASPEIIRIKFVRDGQTDRQTDKFFDTIHGVCGFFLSVKFATSLLASLAGG